MIPTKIHLGELPTDGKLGTQMAWRIFHTLEPIPEFDPTNYWICAIKAAYKLGWDRRGNLTGWD